jgi:RNA polymerase-associated protein CTR9
MQVYSQSLALLKEKDPKTVPPQLLNNIAVLYHLGAESQKDPAIAYKNAESYYQQALTVLSDESFTSTEDPWLVSSVGTTMRFNIARLYESQGDAPKAEIQYKELLKSHPAYIDCNH